MNIRSSKQSTGRAERRYRARRLEILSAAARTFRRQGFATTGMREIAAEADLSAANLYHYFKGKQELLFFCQESSLDAMQRALNAARRTRTTSSARLRRVIEAHVRCILDEVQGSAAHLELEALSPDLRKRLVAKRDIYERGIRKVVARGIETKEFFPCDPKLVTSAILGSLNWTVRWFRPQGVKSPGEIGRELAHYLVRGLMAANQSDGPSARGPSEN